MFGNQIVQFAIGIWIYQQTGSPLSFAGATAAALIPGLLLTPVAGAVVDRLNRFHIVIAANVMSAILLAIFLGLTTAGMLTVGTLYVFSVFGSAIGAFQAPAYQALVGSIIRPDLLTRASGVMGISSSSLAIVAPSIAGFLFAASGLPTLLMIDLATFLVGVGIVWNAFRIARVSMVPSTSDRLWKTVATSFDIFGRSVSIVASNPRLRMLALYTLVQSGFLALVITLVVPLILSIHTTVTLGAIMSAGAVGALVGSSLMAVLDAPKRPVLTILLCDVVIACCVISVAFAHTAWAFGAIEAMAGGASAIASTCAYSMWMSKIPEKSRGSVFSMLASLGTLTTLVMVISGGLLAEMVFEPALLGGGSGIAHAMGDLVGVGKGRGMALMFFFSGLTTLTICLAGLAYRPLREFR